MWLVIKQILRLVLSWSAKIFLALFFPPISVFVNTGYSMKWSFWINCVLTLFLVIPGIYHAFFILLITTDWGSCWRSPSPLRDS